VQEQQHGALKNHTIFCKFQLCRPFSFVLREKTRVESSWVGTLAMVSVPTHELSTRFFFTWLKKNGRLNHSHPEEPAKNIAFFPFSVNNSPVCFPLRRQQTVRYIQMIHQFIRK
jgi:hypothetical protein